MGDNGQPKLYPSAAVIIISSASLLIWSYVSEYRLIGTIIPLLDDTFIHLRFAWNLAHGAGFAFNPGRPLPGSTSPLWVLILSPAAWADKQFLVNASLMMSSLSYVAVGLLTWLLALRIGFSRGLALLAAMLVVMNGRLLWAGATGMETDFFAALSLAAVMVLIREEEKGAMTWRSGALFGLATLARPEGYLLFTIALGHYVLSRIHQTKKIRLDELVRTAPASAIAAFMIVVSPYIIFALVTVHHPFPTTYLAKRPEFGRYHQEYMYWTVRYLWLDNPAAALCFVAAVVMAGLRTARQGLGFIASGAGLTALWAVGYYIVSAIVTPMPYHFCRYQIPVLPFVLLTATLAIADLFGRLEKRIVSGQEEAAGDGGPPARASLLTPLLQFRLLAAGLVLIIFIPGALNVARWAAARQPFSHYNFEGVIPICAKNIKDMHLTVADWLQRGTPPQSVIATMDIGAFGFYTERQIIDIVGLVTPEVIPLIAAKGITRERSRNLFQFLSRTRPDYAVLFPDWYPGLAEPGEIFRPVFEVSLNDPVIVGSRRMVVYQCRWPRENEKPINMQ